MFIDHCPLLGRGARPEFLISQNFILLLLGMLWSVTVLSLLWVSDTLSYYRVTEQITLFCTHCTTLF